MPDGAPPNPSRPRAVGIPTWLVALALAGLAALGGVLLWSRPTGRTPIDSGSVAGPMKQQLTTPDLADSTPPPLLANPGRTARPPPAQEGDAAARPEGFRAPARPSTAAAIAAVTTVADFLAVAPDAVIDGLAPGPLPSFPIPRDQIVGNVLPFGVRDVAGAGLPRWVGVARIERDAPARPSPTPDIEAPATTALTGVVVGEDDQPIPGAEVLVYSSSYVRQAYYDHRVQQIGRALTGYDGVFDLKPIALDTVHFGAKGEVLVTVRHPVLTDVVARSMPAIVAGLSTDVGHLVLPTKGSSLHGVIRDLEGHPVAGAVVRVSGAFDPTAYDKTERMIVLDECPAAVTDAEGQYELGDFAPGDHVISVHIRLDCVLRGSERLEGDHEWSPRVQAGNAVRGRVLDPDGEPVSAAVVAGGGNWTPTNADGTFWLDNVAAGPLTLDVVHHDWHTVSIPGIATNADEITLTMTRRLSRVTLTVLDANLKPARLVAIDWTWPPGGGPGPFAAESRYRHDVRGIFAFIVPEGVKGATVSDSAGSRHTLEAEDLVDGAHRSVTLAARVGGG